MTDIPNATLIGRDAAVLTVGLWKGTRLRAGRGRRPPTILTPTDDPAAQNLRTTASTPKTTTVTFSLPAFSHRRRARPSSSTSGATRRAASTRRTATRRQLDFYVNNGNAFITHPAADDTAPVTLAHGHRAHEPGRPILQRGDGNPLLQHGRRRHLPRRQRRHRCRLRRRLGHLPGARGDRLHAHGDHRHDEPLPVEHVHVDDGEHDLTGIAGRLGGRQRAQLLEPLASTDAHARRHRSQRPDARARGRPLLHEHVRVPDGGGRLRRGRGPRHLLPPLRARLRHAHERQPAAPSRAAGRRSPTRTPPSPRGNCYRYRYSIADNVGNRSATVTASVDAKIDTSAPAAPSLSLAENPADPDQHVSGTTLFYKPGANGGTFRVTATAADAQSGIASAAFPAIANVTGGGTDSLEPLRDGLHLGRHHRRHRQPKRHRPKQRRPHERQRALHPHTRLDRSQRPDARARGRPLLHEHVRVPDGGRRLRRGRGPRHLLPPLRARLRHPHERQPAAPSRAAGRRSPTPTPPSPRGNCYRYRYSIADNVGNRSTTVTASVDAKIDTTAPAAPSLSLAENPADPDQHVSGTTLYYKPGANGGTFRVTATAADAQSGIASAAFPAIANVTGGGTDSSSPYEMDYTWGTTTAATGNQNVTAQNNAGLTSANGPFTLTQDSTAPSGQTLALVGGPYYTSTSVSLTAGDGSDAGAGLDTSSRLYERDSATLTNGSLRRLLGQLDDGLQPGHDRRERQLLPLPLLDRRQRRQPLGHRHRLRRCQNRHLGAFLHRDLPGLRRDVQHRRLERRLRDDRFLRHLLRRRLGRLPGADLDPPGHRQLLERHRFASASEVWNTASLAGGNWSYAFAAASFPADGSYTIRVRATDAAGERRDPDQPQLHDRPRGPADDDRLEPREPDRLDERDASRSAPTRAARPSSAASTAAPGAPAPARATTRASPTAATPSTCAPPTSPATPTPPPPPTPGSSTRPRRARRRRSRPRAASTTRPAGRPGARRPASAAPTRTAPAPASPRCRSPSARARATTGTAPRFASARRGLEHGLARRRQLVVRVRGGQLPGRRQLHHAGARDRRRRQRRRPRRAGRFTYDTTNPSALFTFPASGGNYTNATWNAGCATSGFCGTHSDALSGVQAVQVSIQRVSTGLYWNGTLVRVRARDVPDRRPRRRQLVARLRRGELPGRRPVHGPRARDATTRSNTESGPSRTFRIDNTAPASTVTFPASAGTYNTAGWNAGCATDGFCGTQSDGGSGIQGVEVSIRQGAGNYWNGSGFSSGTEVWNTATLAGGNWSLDLPRGSFPADGSYTVRVRATDVAGNVETPSSRSFTIDRAAPQTTIDSNPADPTALDERELHFSSSEGGSRFECRIDGGAWGACTSPKNYTSLTDGSHTFDVRATDVAGNTDGIARLLHLARRHGGALLDRHLPRRRRHLQHGRLERRLRRRTASAGPTPTAPAPASPRSRSPSARARATTGTAPASPAPPRSGTTPTLAGGNWSLAFPAGSFPADGSYTVRVRAVDDAGTPRAASSRTFTIDRGRAADDDRLQPGRPDRLHLGELRLLRRRGQLDLRVPDRRRRLGRLHQPEELHRASPTAATPSTCAPPTSPATPTPPPPPSPGSSTRPRPPRRSASRPPRGELQRRRLERRLRRRAASAAPTRDGSGSGVAEVEVSDPPRLHRPLLERRRLLLRRPRSVNDATLSGGDWSLRLPGLRTSLPTATTPCASSRTDDGRQRRDARRAGPSPSTRPTRPAR